MIIDSHVHVGKSLFGLHLSPEALLVEMDKLKIDKAIIMPFKPRDYHFEPENDFIAATVNQHPDRFLGFGRVDPWREKNAEIEVIRIFRQLNLSGLFLHPWEENFPLTAPILRPILDIMKEIRKPVMISGGHVRVSHPRQIQYIASEYPDVTFIATSGGQINICGELLSDAEDMLRACPNVIMETSGIYRRDFIEQMTAVLGAERVIYGSGAPYYDLAYEMERIKTAKINKEEKKKLFGESIDGVLDITLRHAL